MLKRSFMCFPSFKEKAVTFSYDDGVQQDKRLIEILDRYSIKCTFNINSGLFDKRTSHEAMFLGKKPDLTITEFLLMKLSKFMKIMKLPLTH